MQDRDSGYFHAKLKKTHPTQSWYEQIRVYGSLSGVYNPPDGPTSAGDADAGVL